MPSRRPPTRLRARTLQHAGAGSDGQNKGRGDKESESTGIEHGEILTQIARQSFSPRGQSDSDSSTVAISHLHSQPHAAHSDAQKHLFWNAPEVVQAIIATQQLSGPDSVGILERVSRDIEDTLEFLKPLKTSKQ